MTGHIVPMGAGLAVMQRRDDPLHDYVLELTGKDDRVRTLAQLWQGLLQLGPGQ